MVPFGRGGVPPPDSSLATGPIREAPVEGACPHCDAANLVMRSLPLNIPYFGDALQTTVLCQSCSFRHADLLLLHQGPPTRHEMRVEGADDLSARVVRSSAATIRIPELPAKMEPGLRAEAFVSNAEGVLHRFRDAAETGLRGLDDPAAKRRAQRAVRMLEGMIEGRGPFTLILEDPSGNSAILHDRAKKTILTDREAARLQRKVPRFRVVP